MKLWVMGFEWPLMFCKMTLLQWDEEKQLEGESKMWDKTEGETSYIKLYMAVTFSKVAQNELTTCREPRKRTELHFFKSSLKKKLMKVGSKLY